MMDTYTIAPATVLDVADIMHLVNNAYRGETAKKGWTHEANLLDGIRTDAQSLTDLFSDKKAILLKSIHAAHQLVGCVYLKGIEDKLYLGMLTVKPTLQGRGIGKQLLHAAEAYAKDMNYKAIVMTVISVRHELIDWYQRHGYTPTGQTEPFPDDPRLGIPKQPLEFIVMQKVL